LDVVTIEQAKIRQSPGSFLSEIRTYLFRLKYEHSRIDYQGEYHNCPPTIFLKLVGLEDSEIWEDTQAQNLLPDFIFTVLKIALHEKYFFGVIKN